MSKEVNLSIEEANISIACLLDDVEVDKIGKFCPHLITDLKHIQDQITIIKNYLEELNNDTV
tara:strand:+ start:236 stop:421 length:186 start_codon:yes stop_codon:yes gene_type:complete